MSDTVRRAFNQVEQWFDRRALRAAVRATRPLGGAATAQSALAALAPARAAAAEFDSGALLKMIVAPDGTDRSGASTRWEFFFDLPARMAKLTCTWRLPWEEARDAYAAPELVLRAEPFPPEGNSLRVMVTRGQLLYAQLRGSWRQEVARTPVLPAPFRDSPEALAEAIAQGLAVADDEFSVGTGTGPAGDPCWIIASRHRRYFAQLRR